MIIKSAGELSVKPPLELKNKLPMSLVVITLNEELNLERCLKSAVFIEDVVIVDSYSTDRTVEIAQNYGAKVIQQEFLGFAAQKNLGAEKAKYDWVLSLDADEALSEAAGEYLKHNFESLDANRIYRFSRKSYYWRRWIKFGGWYPDFQQRLYNRKFAKWAGLIHEKVSAKELDAKMSIENTGQDLLHWVFRDISHQVSTNNKYSSLQAHNYIKNGGKFSVFKLLTKPWVKFFECYLGKLGILDGLPGFVIAVGAAYSVFIRWVKIWEAERKVI